MVALGGAMMMMTMMMMMMMMMMVAKVCLGCCDVEESICGNIRRFSSHHKAHECGGVFLLFFHILKSDSSLWSFSSMAQILDNSTAVMRQALSITSAINIAIVVNLVKMGGRVR